MTGKIIPVTDRGCIVGEVMENHDLENFEDRTGFHRHSGITQLEDGRFVYIRSSDWVDEESRAYVITPIRALELVLMSEDREKLLNKFPELERLRKLFLLHEKGGEK